VLATAHKAFVQGLHVAALVAASIAVVMAALNIVLRDPEPHQP
jgi:hypothetical protein